MRPWNLIVVLAVGSQVSFGQEEPPAARSDRQPAAGRQADGSRQDESFPVSLEFCTQRLGEQLQDSPFPGDNLAELKPGLFETLQGVRFTIGDRFAALSGKFAPNRPERINIPVNRSLSQLFALQACGWGAFGGPGDPAGHYVPDGTIIGYYRINFADDDYEVWPITYGSDVRDWWGIWDRFKPTKFSTIAWRGTNEHVKGRDEARDEPAPLRLFLSAWKNPHPEKMVISIDFVSVGGVAAPFCVALSGLGPVEERRAADQANAAAALRRLQAEIRILQERVRRLEEQLKRASQ